MKTCNRICDVANDGICMSVCSMGLSATGYQVTESGDNVYLLHNSLNGSLAKISKSDTDKVAKLTAFVQHQN